MKIRTLFLATAVLATASSFALAQVPTERTGSKTEQTQMQKDKMGDMKNTTGSGMTNSGMTQPMTTETPPRNNPNGTPTSPEKK